MLEELRELSVREVRDELPRDAKEMLDKICPHFPWTERGCWIDLREYEREADQSVAESIENVEASGRNEGALERVQVGEFPGKELNVFTPVM